MSDAAAILSPSKPAVTPNRGLAQGQRQPNEAANDAEAGFSDLLVEVEELASNAEQVLTPDSPAIQALRIAMLENPGQQQTPAQPGLIEAAPAFTAKKAVENLIAQQRGVSRDNIQRATAPLQHNIDGGARREVLELRPFATAAAQPVNPFQNPMQNPALMAEELQLAEQLKGGAAPKLETQIAATPRLEATLAQQASPETSNPVVRQVAANLQFVARGDMERVRFDLFPEELGRVQVQLQKSGAVTRLTIVTETAQAFEALARGANGLQASLQQSGFDTDDLQFEHRENRGEEREAMDERRERREEARRENEPNERREVIVRPALTRADQALFL